MRKIFLMIVCLALLMPAVLKAQIYTYDDGMMYEEDYALFGTETPSEQFGGALSHLDMGLNVSGGLTGQIVRPFDNGGNGSQEMFAELITLVNPGQQEGNGDPTNQIPLGSGLCLLIGIVLFAAARAIRVLVLTKKL